MRLILALLCSLALTGCSDSSSPGDDRDAGGNDDGGHQDAGDPRDLSTTDTGSPVDLGETDGGTTECPVSCIRTVVRWGLVGGRVPETLSYDASDCGRVAREAVNTRNGDHSLCVAYLDQEVCSLVDTVGRALRDDDVVAALEDAPVLYGIDSRPVDGSVFEIDVEGDVITIGDPCGGTTGCPEVPPGVAALRDALQTMQERTDASPACAAPIGDPETFGCDVWGGETIQCLIGDEYCFTPFSCTPTPDSCEGPATCECLDGLGFPCEEARGGVTVQWLD